MLIQKYKIAQELWKGTKKNSDEEKQAQKQIEFYGKQILGEDEENWGEPSPKDKKWGLSFE